VAAALVAASGCGASVAAPPSRAITVSSPRTLPRDVPSVSDMAAGRDGTLAVVFHRYRRHDEGVAPLYVAIRRPNGRWTRARALSDPRYGVEQASVAVDPLGGVTAAWVRTRCRVGNPPRCGRPEDTFYQARSRPAGGHWGPVETLGPAGFESPLAIAAEAGGGASVAFNSVGGVSVARHATGQHFERPASFGISGPGPLALATSEDGRAYLAYATASAAELGLDHPQSFIVAAARGADGRWNSPSRVSGRPAAQPAITVAADGAVVVAWRETPTDNPDYFRYGGVAAAIGTAGGTFGPPRHVADALAYTVRLASGRAGATVLTWAGAADAGRGPVRYAARAAGTSRFGPGRPVHGTSDYQAISSTVAVLDDGTALLVHADASDVLQLAIRPRGGRFGRARAIARHARFPIVVVGTGRRAMIVYEDVAARAMRYVTAGRP
jgi:hypothetical protein